MSITDRHTFKGPLKGRKILITCGPTWVPIDEVRVISNQSTGTLGKKLAKDLRAAGANVTLLMGPVTQPMPLQGIRILKFTFYDDLARLVNREARKNYDVCIHAAAVSDYRLKRPAIGKLSSQTGRLTLTLVPTAKIIHRIKKLNPNIFLVGFKLEPRLTRASARIKARPLLTRDLCDLVVVNSVNGQKYSAWILDRAHDLSSRTSSRAATARALVKRLIKVFGQT